MMRQVTSAALVLALALTSAAWAQNPAKVKRRPEADRAREGTLQPGDEAPNFKLKKLDSGDEVELVGFRGRPVVLVFGSYT
jgi:cytochrome oxidase Cu insertion factor (SCO1/SenC/PrrC family)